MGNFVLYEKKENVAWLTINRPESLNAISTGVMEELLAYLNEAEKDMDILCIVLTGAGEKAFSAGGDIKEELKTTSAMAVKFCTMAHTLCSKFQTIRMPVIAAVNGYALGGGMEFALACDFIVAADTAKFGLVAVNMGIISGFGGTQNIVRAVGKARAKELMYTGRMLKAEECYDLGIVQKVVEKATFIDGVTALANEIASKPPYAIRATKEAVTRGVEVDMETAYLLETGYAAPCYDTEDKHEAMTAFIEKRKPNKYINR
ncbi:MAG: enoyl-CoA hydratase-related protein [Lachnospiraceae bacterium]|nr:enoyl-CoA hydratase-related protein [Lachnospiraceae bacterium]